MYTLDYLQKSVRGWKRRNVSDQSTVNPFVGIVKSVGILAHAILKKDQHIHPDENHKAQMTAAVGDIVIYLADICERADIDLNSAVWTTWNNLKQKDWTKEKGDVR